MFCNDPVYQLPIAYCLLPNHHVQVQNSNADVSLAGFAAINAAGNLDGFVLGFGNRISG